MTSTEASSPSSSSLPAWLQNINDQLEEKYRTIEAPFEGLILAYGEGLQREEAATDEQDVLSEQLQRHQEALRIVREELESLKGGAIDSKKFLELDSKYRQVKQERIELLRTQSQNTQRLLQLNEQLKEAHSYRVHLEDEISKQRISVEERGRKIEYYQQLLEEKNLNIQVLHDELQALQLELLQTDERVKSLQAENQQLVQRWLSKVNEEVHKMNTEMSIHEATTCLLKTNLDRPLKGLASTRTSDLIFIAAEDGPLLSRALQTTINLATLALRPPNRATFSRDNDLLVGFEGEMATFWNVVSGKIVNQLSVDPGKGFIDISPISSTNDALVSLHEQNMLRFYDIPRSFCLWTEPLDCTPQQVQLLHGDTVVILSNDGLLQLWDITHRKLIRKSSASQLPSLISLCTAHQNTLVAATERAIHTIDPSTLKIIQSVSLQGTPSVIAAHADRFVVGVKSRIIVGELQTGKILGTINDHEHPLVGLGFVHLDGKPVIVSADAKGTMALRALYP